MPKFFDDYSNTYLTHDSAAGRKQQRRGWKFRENFKLHYEKQLDEWRAGPMGIAAQQQAYIRSNGNNPNVVPPLPDGWEEEEDEATRAKFYINKKTQERSWTRPGFNLGAMMSGPPPPMMMGGPPPPMLGPPPVMQLPLPGGVPPSMPPPPNFAPPPPGSFLPPPTGGPPVHFPPPPTNFPPPPGTK